MTIWKSVLFLFALLLALSLSKTETRAGDSEWPQSFSVGTSSAGTTNYVIQVAIGRTIEKHTPMKHWLVKPLGGAVAYAKQMNQGELDFFAHNGADCIDLLFGRGVYEDVGPTAIRTVFATYPLVWVFWTLPNSGISKLEDLKGKIVYTKMMGNPLFERMTNAMFESAGFTEKDLRRSMPFPNVREAANDLIDGRVDAFFFPIVPSVVQRISASKGGVTFVNMTQDQAVHFVSNVPGFYYETIPENAYGNKSELPYAIVGQSAVLTRADIHPDIIKKLCEVVMENRDEWVDVHPEARRIGLDHKPVTTATVLYHPGAVEYFKERGLWTEQMDTFQTEMVQQLKTHNLPTFHGE